MPLISTNVFGKASNTAFDQIVQLALVQEANERLADGAVPVGNTGHMAYLKRMDFAKKVLQSPKIYSNAFCMQLLLVDQEFENEQDVGTMKSNISNNGIFDKVAGISQLDLA